MMIERRILEGLDAARPGSDDLEDPEFAELAEARELHATDPAVAKAWQQVQRLDHSIGAALGEVPVPGGLAARLLAHLTENAVEPEREPDVTLPAAPTDAVSAVAIETSDLVEQPLTSRASRRRWLGAAVALAASALIAAVGVSRFWRTDPPLTQDDLESLALQWFDEAQEAADWQAPDSAPQQRPFPSTYLSGRALGFRPVNTPHDPEAVAYEVKSGQKRALLFLLNAPTAANLGPVPPPAPHYDTGNRAIGLWQRGDGMVFALVVEGTADDYRRFLSPQIDDLG